MQPLFLSFSFPPFLISSSTLRMPQRELQVKLLNNWRMWLSRGECYSWTLEAAVFIFSDQDITKVVFLFDSEGHIFSRIPVFLLALNFIVILPQQ